MQNSHDFAETVARYREEMRKLQEKSELPPSESPAAATAFIPLEPQPAAVEPQPAAVEPQPAPAPLPVAPEEAVFAAAPPFGNDVDGTAQTDEETDFVEPPAEDETDEGLLVVQLNSARGTIPIAGATVTVFRTTDEGDQLLHIGETDESGSSPVWTLATKDRDLSLEPGEAVPYVNYAVQANAEGYVTFLNRGVSVFGGVKTVQRILMLPLPEPTAAFDQIRLETRAQNTPPELN